MSGTQMKRMGVSIHLRWGTVGPDWPNQKPKGLTMMMLMQETGGELGSFLFMLGGLAMITMVLWIFLPFAVFGIKGRLTNILDEQRRTTSAVNALKSDVWEIARNALRERPRRREIPDQGAPSGELEASRFIPN